MAPCRDVPWATTERGRRAGRVVAVVLGVVCCASRPAIASDVAADRVLGQVSFAYDAANLVDDRGLQSPVAVAIDRSVTPNRIYVADTTNSRVLAWSDVSAFANGASADLVIGQPDSSSFACNTGGVSAASLCHPRGVAVDGAGNLYVADADNGRVLEYDTPLTSGTSADRVFGQGGSLTAQGCNAGGVSASSLCNPHGLALDAEDNLYVADYGNNRLLEYDTPLASDTSADRVFGQAGSFVTVACNAGGVSASTLCRPYGVRLDGAGNLYVADQVNNRVLEYDTPLTSDTSADRVFGQGGSFTTNACDGVGVASANSFCNPTDVAVDGSGNVYVADWANNRVLEYNTPLTSGTTADRVFGQGGSFTTDSCNNGLATGASAGSLCNATGVALDAAGDLYVADTGNHRVLKYITPLSPFGAGTTADRVLGQAGLTYNGANLVDARGLSDPTAVAIDRSVTPHRLYVADLENSRVLAWADAAAFVNGGPANLVIGQPDFFSSACNTGGRSASSLCKPSGVAVDGSGNVYVADYTNRRVLEYDTPFASGTTADRVFGRGGSFTTQGPACSTSAISADSICNPGGVAVDPAGNLYVVDGEYDRVLEYDTPLASDTIADRVFGQGGSFTTTGCNTGGLSASSLCTPGDVAVDGAGNLWVSDTFNHRVLHYETPLSDTTADGVIGQGGSFTANTCNPGGVSADGLCYPEGIAVDGPGNLYVVDWDNHRVLGYHLPLATDATADYVFGQGGSFTSQECNLGGVSAASLCRPFGVTIDGDGDVYVADRDNNRVLEYDAPIACGDGFLDSGEACDDGNLVAGDCCSILCQFEPAGTPCRTSGGVCDPGETCTGSSGSCPADLYEPATTECRASAGECDPAESCTGAAPGCPADARAPTGIACTSDGNPCSLDQCDGVSLGCQHPAGNAGAVCRSSAGVCDVPETCTGTGTACPADAFAPAATTCRGAAGGCDVAETCTGTSATCPADAFQPSITLCRAATDVCDAVEHCTGLGATCPPDGFESSTTVCRPTAGACDVDERCTGTGPTCPLDTTQPDGTPCDDTNACTTPDACQTGACVGTIDPLCSDHYLCYTAKTGGVVPIAPAHLVDAFEEVTATIGKPKLLCAAADTNAEGVLDPDTHQRAFPFKQTPGHLRWTATTVDRFGTWSLTATKPDLLFVPTAADLGSLPSPPDPNAINVNHFKCYRVKVTAGELPRGTQVLVTDQLTSSQKRFDVRKPRHLCTPVDTNGEGIDNPASGLVCYQVKSAKGQPRHVAATVFLNNHFTSETVRTLKESELCVPSQIDP